MSFLQVPLSLMCVYVWAELELEETESKCSDTGAVGMECSGVVLFWYGSSIQLPAAWLVSDLMP